MDSFLKLRLSHPYLTRYYVTPAKDQSSDENNLQLLRICKGWPSSSDQTFSNEFDPPTKLHSNDLYFTIPQEPERQSSVLRDGDNTAWARSQRSMVTTLRWRATSAEERPTTGQIWLVAYALFTLRPDLESIRVALHGAGCDSVRRQVLACQLAIQHPARWERGGSKEARLEPAVDDDNEILFLRGNFWQGAGSPFEGGAVWNPRTPEQSAAAASTFILDYCLTSKFPSANVHAWHPRRPPKPAPGSVIYSRYIPHLDEQFSMVALDCENEEHLKLFHTWQNDPRVARGWNESGTLEHHQKYLQRMHDDTHQIAVLALFEGTPFAYFEIYWAKVCDQPRPA